MEKYEGASEEAARGQKLYDNTLLTWMENNGFIMAMRQGLRICIPVLLIGSFCLMFTSFPIPIYQTWLGKVFDGWLLEGIFWIHTATIGTVTLYVILAISYCYGKQKDNTNKGSYMMTSLVSYIIFVQHRGEPLSNTFFDYSWIFAGIVITLSCCFLLRKYIKLFARTVKYHSFAGLDLELRSTVAVILPFLGVVLTVLLVKLLLIRFFGAEAENFGNYILSKIFGNIGTGFLGALVFVFLIHIVWFFGIHGSNMLGFVSMQLFEQNMLLNMAAVTAGREATSIFTKTFFDVFVLMGGSGATICLLIALLIQKKKQAKTLFHISIIPTIFNINEVVLFGLPVISNPIMIIPFTLVPLVLMVVSAFSMYLGLVPVPFVQVEWTTPVFFSGYLCTQSIAGVILQVVLIGIGTLIYMPFIRISDLYYGKKLQRNVHHLIDELKECEHMGEQVDFREGNREKQEIAKMLLGDLQIAVMEDKFNLFYQPQINSDGTVYGVEALLRWKHSLIGYLYPPLVIELARQNGLLDELGLLIIEKAAKDLEVLAGKMNAPIHMAVNISPAQFEMKDFSKKVLAVLGKYEFRDCQICFEVTEQLSLLLTDTVVENIRLLREAGYNFHMDDFGMGHSSMKYLQSNEFEAVKIDGSLIKELLSNKRSQEIISGIRQMAPALRYELIAEYVETKEQRDRLEGLGCFIYQGALYGMAVPRDELERYLEGYDMIKGE